MQPGNDALSQTGADFLWKFYNHLEFGKLFDEYYESIDFELAVLKTMVAFKSDFPVVSKLRTSFLMPTFIDGCETNVACEMAIRFKDVPESDRAIKIEEFEKTTANLFREVREKFIQKA